MGLDMYLRRVTKPELEDRLYTRKELDELRIRTREVDDDLCEAIRNNSVEVNVIDKMYKMEKLAQKAGIEFDKVSRHYVLSESFNEKGHFITFCFEDDKNEPLGGITIDAEDENYLQDIKRTMRAYIVEEIDYQRKGLNEEGCDLLPENCEACDDFKVVEALVERGGLSDTFLENWEDGCTIFVAWW